MPQSAESWGESRDSVGGIWARVIELVLWCGREDLGVADEVV